MIPVLDVARYIINYSNEKNYSISNLKLQKLLYLWSSVHLYPTAKNIPTMPKQS